jgi:gentisate 1,2-dioxygenase
MVDEQRLEWNAGDTFVVPAWRWRCHANAGVADAVLFQMDDAPALRALGLYREQPR